MNHKASLSQGEGQGEEQDEGPGEEQGEGQGESHDASQLTLAGTTLLTR